MKKIFAVVVFEPIENFKQIPNFHIEIIKINLRNGRKERKKEKKSLFQYG